MGKGLGVVLKYKPQKFFISYICGGGERERERDDRRGIYKDVDQESRKTNFLKRECEIQLQRGIQVTKIKKIFPIIEAFKGWGKWEERK